jgi:hypothetical protein
MNSTSMRQISDLRQMHATNVPALMRLTCLWNVPWNAQLLAMLLGYLNQTIYSSIGFVMLGYEECFM